MVSPNGSSDKIVLNSNKKRTLVMDNFYTRNVLAGQLRLISEEDIGIIGTVCFKNVDALNHPRLK